MSCINKIVYYEKPLLTFERLLETYLGVAPRGGRSFIAAMKLWVKEKLFLKSELKRHFDKFQKYNSSNDWFKVRASLKNILEACYD